MTSLENKYVKIKCLQRRILCCIIKFHSMKIVCFPVVRIHRMTFVFVLAISLFLLNSFPKFSKACVHATSADDRLFSWLLFSENCLFLNWNLLSFYSVGLLVFRRKILCDAKPKPVSRKFWSNRGSLMVVGGGGWVNYQMQIVTKLPNENIQTYQLQMIDSGGGG